MQSVQKSRSLPLKAKLIEIPIKRTPKTISSQKMKKYYRDNKKKSLNNHPDNREKSRIVNRRWNADPRNKVLRNIRQRLRRYKTKLSIDLPTIWYRLGLITLQHLVY